MKSTVTGLMQVVIDSTEIYEDWGLVRLLGQRLPTLRRAGHRLVVPVAVLDEHWGQATRTLDEWFAHSGSRLATHLGIALGKSDRRGDLEQEKSAAIQRMLASGVDVRAYPSVPHSTVLQRCIARRKPFDLEGRGYGDALIWYTVVELCQAASEPIAFITNNAQDFLAKEQLHADLIADLDELGIPPTRIETFRDFYQFNKQKIAPTLATASDVEQAIGAEHMPLDLKAWLERDGLQLFRTRDLMPYEIGARFDRPRVSLSRIVRVRRVHITDVRSIPPSEVVVYATALIEATVTWPMVSYDRQYAYLSDVNGFTVAEVTGEIEIDFYVQLDRPSGGVTSSELGAVRPGHQPPGEFAPTITHTSRRSIPVFPDLTGAINIPRP